jgi:capsular exopolysaccharide synthesis family protein
MNLNLKDHLRILRQNVALVIAAVLFCAAGAAGSAVLLPTTYSSQTELFVSIPNAGDPYDLQLASTFTQERIQTYVDMTDSRAVLEPVIENLRLDETPSSLADRVEAFSDPGTVLIAVEATDTSPEGAAAISEAVATSLVEVIGSLENSEATGTSPIQLAVANPAEVPTDRNGPPLWLWILLGMSIGIGAGIGLAFLRSALDNTLRSREDLPRITGAPVLASIPADPAVADVAGMTDGPVHSAGGEAFRRLRTNLRFAQVDDTNSAVLLTSAQAQEGKTTTSINLAVSAAQSGQRVALVDADLRRPSVAERLGLENAAGLTTALLGSADVADLLQPWGPDELYVLTAGEIPPNPAELLDSRAMTSLINRLLNEFDLVVVDGAPLLPVADSLVLAKHVGRVLLVAEVGKVRLSDLQEVVCSLEMLEVSKLGIVLNKVPSSSPEMKGYTRGYYAASPEEIKSSEEGRRARIFDAAEPQAAGESAACEPLTAAAPIRLVAAHVPHAMTGTDQSHMVSAEFADPAGDLRAPRATISREGGRL